MFGLSETQLFKILPPLISLLALVLVSVVLWRLRKRIISGLKENVYISNDRGQVVLHAPPLKPYYRLFLGTKNFEQVKRRQESKLLYLEPIVEDAQAMISSGRASGSEEEAVYFTAFYPKRPTVGTWHNLVIYMHTKSTLAEIQKDIDKYSDELAGLEDAPEPPNIKMKNRRTAWLTQGSRVTLLPRIDGITFNPPFQNMWWVEDFNRASLYFMGGPTVLNTTLSGEIAVHVGLMEIATLPITIRFAEARPPDRRGHADGVGSGSYHDVSQHFSLLRQSRRRSDRKRPESAGRYRRPADPRQPDPPRQPGMAGSPAITASQGKQFSTLLVCQCRELSGSSAGIKKHAQHQRPRRHGQDSAGLLERSNAPPATGTGAP